jgi:NADPH-dependent curcumin reductase CurA
MAAVNRQWILVNRPEGEIDDSNLELRESPVPEPGEGEVLIRHIYLSLDPTDRIWMSDIDQYMPPVEIGGVMRGGTIGVVEASKSDRFKAGDVVQGLGNWQDYSVHDARALAKIDTSQGLPLTAYMGLLGSIGATAYFGLLDIGQPKEGETVVVSAAAGAVGSIAGQIAKIKGCRVVGIAGADDKCAWIRDDLGFDAAINYKKEDVLEALRKHCPDGIDVDFENVGGETLDAVLTLINVFGRIALCGMISQYNLFQAGKDVPGPYMFRNILMKRVKVQGFIVTDFRSRFPEAMADLAQWLKAGKLQYRVDVEDGLENAPQAVKKLFIGANTGKLMVKVSEEP